MASFFRNLFSSSGGDENEENERRVTREAVYKKEKERLMQLSLEEKRTLYKCGSKFKQLPGIVTWSEYFKEDQERLLKLREKKKSKKLYPEERHEDGTPKEVRYKVNEDFNNKVSIWRGDITCLEIDAIVNAANQSLLGGGGVDGAIHSAAGSCLKSECASLHGCDTGDAKITSGYKLPAKHVIHTVGPIGYKPELLESCYKRCFEVAMENNVRSIAFPCVSTGIYGYPNDHACETALRYTREFLEREGHEKVDRIIFCLFLPVDVKLYEELMQIYFPVETENNEDSKEGQPEEKEKDVKGKEHQPVSNKTTTAEMDTASDVAEAGTAPAKVEANEDQGQTTKDQSLHKEGESQQTTDAPADQTQAAGNDKHTSDCKEEPMEVGSPDTEPADAEAETEQSKRDPSDEELNQKAKSESDPSIGRKDPEETAQHGGQASECKGQAMESGNQNAKLDDAENKTEQSKTNQSDKELTQKDQSENDPSIASKGTVDERNASKDGGTKGQVKSTPKEEPKLQQALL